MLLIVARVGFAPTNHCGLGYEPSEFDYFSTSQYYFSETFLTFYVALLSELQRDNPSIGFAPMTYGLRIKLK